MNRRAISIQDIAQAAGVSHTTVSRALRGSPLISAEVREHVQLLAAQMGYTPNAVAQSLKGQRTNTIGVVVTSVADPFYGRLVRGIDQVARQADVDVFLGLSYGSADEELAVIESFHRRRVEGIISASSGLGATQLDRLARRALPIVLINREAEGAHDVFRSVQVDSYAGGREAVRHLLALGHRAIAYLGATNRPASNRQRMAGYCDALTEAGVEAPDGWIQQAPPERRSYSDDVADGRELMVRALHRGITAAFCYNDMHAVGALLACRELGISVPEQVSIVGFDGVELAQYVTPPLTTVHQPKLRLGQLAAEMLLKLMQEQPVEDAVVEPELVQRCSSGPAPADIVKLPAEREMTVRKC